jgi:hypothetical protein
VEFASVVNALTCAVDIQRAVAQHNTGIPAVTDGVRSAARRTFGRVASLFAAEEAWLANLPGP